MRTRYFSHKVIRIATHWQPCKMNTDLIVKQVSMEEADLTMSFNVHNAPDDCKEDV